MLSDGVSELFIYLKQRLVKISEHLIHICQTIDRVKLVVQKLDHLHLNFLFLGVAVPKNLIEVVISALYLLFY